MDGTGYTTGTNIGTGKANTATIVNFFDTIYQSGNPSVTYYNYNWAGLTSGTVDFTDGTNIYKMDNSNNGDVAAKICDEYVVEVGGVTYDDWYLPSKEELNKLYVNKNEVCGFVPDYYWSSSESEFDASTAWFQDFSNGDKLLNNRDDAARVRAVRAFNNLTI